MTAIRSRWGMNGIWRLTAGIFRSSFLLKTPSAVQEPIHFRTRALRTSTDVLHVPHCNCSASLPRQMIVTVHDLTHLIIRSFCRSRRFTGISNIFFGAVCRHCGPYHGGFGKHQRDLLRFPSDLRKFPVVPFAVGSEFVRKERASLEYLYERYSIPRDKKAHSLRRKPSAAQNLERLMESVFQNARPRRLPPHRLMGFENYAGNAREKELGIGESDDPYGMVSPETWWICTTSRICSLPSALRNSASHNGRSARVQDVACSNASSLPEGSAERFTRTISTVRYDGNGEVLESAWIRKNPRSGNPRMAHAFRLGRNERRRRGCRPERVSRGTAGAHESSQRE